MGWTADTLFHSLFFGLPKNLSEAENFFGSISSGSSVLLGHLLSLVLTAIIVSSGIKKGIEKVTRFFTYTFYNSSITSNMGHFTLRRMGRIQNIFV
jgi:SNF family Na+-dependent transporter